MSSFEEAYYNAESFWSNGAVQDPGNMARVRDTASLLPTDVRSLLDAGCGNGVFGQHLNAARPEIEVTGVDRSPAALRYVGTAKREGDVTALPAEDRSFDAVTCLQVVEHLPVGAYEQALSELARVARKYVIVSVPYREVTERNVTTCPQCRTRFNVDLHLRRFDEEMMHTLLDAEGFRHVQDVFPQLHLRYIGLSELNEVRARLRGPKAPVFLAPICPVCGYTEGDQTALSSRAATLPLPARKWARVRAGVKVVAGSAKQWWPRTEHRGYWIVSLYERA